MRFNYKFENKLGMLPYRYDNGKIYKITSIFTNDVYIGSTTDTLSRRLSLHKSQYRRLKEGLKTSNMASFKILQYNDYEIELICNYPCNNKLELLGG